MFLEGTGVSVGFFVMAKLQTLVLFDVERDVVFLVRPIKTKSSKFEVKQHFC